MTSTKSEVRNFAKANSAQDKLIVALDVDTPEEARDIVYALRGTIKWFKIGSQLFTVGGAAVVRQVIESGARVFLDLKFHDIPNTVAAASREAVRMEVSMFNIHALGGSEMMRRAAEATHTAAEDFSVARPLLIAVTLLTSHDAATLREINLNGEIKANVARLARLAAAAGLDGVVASAHEAQTIRRSVEAELNFSDLPGSHPKFHIVTPGVRPESTAHDDQKRVMTPREAIRAGADFLVIGRAIINAPNQAQAAENALAEINAELEKD